MSNRPHFHLSGTRTDAYTGEQHEVVVEAEPYLGSGNETWIRLRGGPTGYESISLAGVQRCAMDEVAWLACIGTPYIPGGNAWDRLEIPASEMRELLKFLEARS